MAGDRPGVRIAVWLAAIAAAAAVVVIAARGCDRPDAPSAGAGSSAGGAAPPPGHAGPGNGSSPGAGESRAPRAPEARDARVAAAGSDSASALVEAGGAAAAARRYEQALALYQRAYELDAQPETLLEIGRMQHLTSRCREARRTTQRVLASSPAPAVAEDARRLLERIGRCD